MNHLLITGATGFIGSNLLPILIQKNYQITVTTRREFNQVYSNQVKVVPIPEMNGLTDWSEALKGVEVVIHLAARAHILTETIPDVAGEFHRVNTAGTANLAQQAQQAGVKQFIFISSVGAMTTLSNERLTEASPCHPDTPYGRSKWEAEQALMSLTENSSMFWTILRPTLVYGPGNPGNMERLIKLVRLSLPLPLGGINNRRSLLYVGNLVDAIAKIIGNPQAFNQIFLLSDGEDVSTSELLRYLADSMGRSCQLLPISSKLLVSLGSLGTSIESWTGKSLPVNKTTMERLLGSLFVDNSYIQSTLDWYPPYTLKQGLEKTINS